MGQTGGHKKADFVFLPYISFQIYPCIPPYGSNWGHKIVDFVFWPFISFILAFTALECIKRYWETICEESR